MIKKYKNFIKESKEELDLDKALLNITYGNYSSMCKRKESPDDRFNEILEELEEYNWSFDRIRKEFDNDAIMSLYSRMDSQNGEVDLFFYKIFEKFGLDKDIVRLGGPGWDDIDVTEDEAFIRYRYGYHNTEYGMMSINQIDGGLSTFLEKALEYLKEFIYQELPYVILSIYVSNNKRLSLVFYDELIRSNFFKIDDFIITEEDRMIIFANDICNFLNNSKMSNDIPGGNYLEIKSDDIYEKLLSFLSDFKDFVDIDFNGVDVIIWSDFKNQF